MTGFFLKLRQRFCRHRWRISRFQPLIPGTSYTCVKCDMHEQFYRRPPAASLATASEGSKPAVDLSKHHPLCSVQKGGYCDYDCPRDYTPPPAEREVGMQKASTKKTFLICPVRGKEPSETEAIDLPPPTEGKSFQNMVRAWANQ